MKDKRNVAAEQFSQALYDRSWIRFYFSFNHYRTIAFNTSAGQLVINPWFAVAEA